MQNDKEIHKNVFFFIFLALLIIQFCSTGHVYASGEPDYVGIVVDDETGEPLAGAKVTVFYRRIYRRYSSRWYTSRGAETGVDGRFMLTLGEDNSYLLLVTHGDERNYDYIPYGVYFTPDGEQTSEEIRLWKAEKLIIDGKDFFIETAVVPDITVRVIDSTDLTPISYGAIGLSYGTGTDTLSTRLDIPIDTVYVPRDKEFRIRVTATGEGDGKHLSESVILDGLDLSDTYVDLRNYVLPRNLDVINNVTQSAEALINGREEEGFFLAVERQKLGKAESLVASALVQIDSGLLDEAFTRLREAYVILSDLQRTVTTMHDSALQSVFILIVFIGVTSQVVATLLFEDNARKMVTGGVVFISLLLVLCVLHPGAQITEAMELVRMGVFTLIVVSILGFITPRLLQRGEETSSPSIRHMVIPILSISKRSLKRRKLRFLLTLTSVLLLVASFISLTSFTSGFGLSLVKIDEPLGKSGVIIRTPDQPPTRSAAPFCGGTGVSGPAPLDQSLVKWFSEANGVVTAIPRYENQPQRQYRESYDPITVIGRVNVFGILAVDPVYEADVNSLDQAVVEGRYIGESAGEVMVSVGMSERIQRGVGDEFSFRLLDRTYDFTIVGLLDDDVLTGLTDIDGESFLPKKVIEWARVVYDGPDHVVEAIAPCTPDEVLIINHASRTNMTSIILDNIRLVTERGIDPVEFARTTALNRGFRVWASTPTGVYLARLADYFNGKGLPIVIPWVIVVLNVVVTMMNAYYERRHEVMIFSSIGMNPRHISAIFLAEASVTGIIGGCMGYLLGLGAYKFIYLVTPALQVQQKVSAFWSLGAIGISLAAVLIGGIIALRNSVAITPSLRRRWSLDQPGDRQKVTQINLPVHVYPEELDEYIDFLEERLTLMGSGELRVKMLKKLKEGEVTVFTFIHSSEGNNISRIYTKNRLVIERSMDETYATTLYTDGDRDSVKKTGGLLRRICLDWSIEREKN